VMYLGRLIHALYDFFVVRDVPNHHIR